MDDLISPKYQMKLVKSVHDAIWEEYKSYKEVKLYIEKWHHVEDDNNFWENFSISFKDKDYKEIDLLQTLHNMAGGDLLKVAIDIGVDTPDFIPAIPTFKNEIKSSYKTAYDTFSKAYRQIETDPGIAIGLANSALESIIKEILKDERLSDLNSGNETLYKLTNILLKELNLRDDNSPKEIKTIVSALLSINQSIEKLRSEKTNFHGKTQDDYQITDSLYTYFVVNSVSTVGLFLNSYYKTKFPPKPIIDMNVDDLPF